MRIPMIVLLLLLCFSTNFSQTKRIVEDKGNFGLHVVDDSILLHKYLERENQLLLIGRKNLQLLDLTNFKVIDTRPVDLPLSDLRAGYDFRDWTISPNGRGMALVGLREARTKTKTEDKQAAWILDLQTGKRVALLDRPNQIRTALWSKNGRTLITMDSSVIHSRTKTLNVSFWDGETFEYRHSITVESATWIYLSNDGERFFAASGKPKNFMGIKYVGDSDSIVRVWRTKNLELEKIIAVGNADFHPKTKELEISPDEEFLVMVNQHKSIPSRHRLLVWKIDGDIKKEYELQPQPKIDDSRVAFSPDGRLFALDVGKNLQIYETETGKLKAELTNFELPSGGWLDNEIFASIDYKSKNFFDMGKTLKGFNAHDGRLLFKQTLAYDETKETNIYSPNAGDTVVIDDTILRPHPARKIFLTSSNQFVKIFDSRTGELLQTVVEPPVVFDLMGKRKPTFGKMVLSADWSKDGSTLYVFSANYRSVSLWKLVD